LNPADVDRLKAAKPLQGVRVLDASHVFAVPYATALLADLGADVIKVQSHTRVDVMAPLGPFPENDPGERPYDRVGSLNTVNRGKRGLSLDISRPEGADLFRRLCEVSDVVAESFTPRVMKKLGLDYAALRALRPGLIMLSNTGYGHTGPWREFGSVATSLEATSGMCWLSGYEGGAPSKIGQSYTDFLACWNAVYAILLALFHRRRTGRGQWIDLAMYQAGVATIGPQVLDWQANGKVATRMGNANAQMAPHGVYPCQGKDRWIAIAVDSDAAWQALCGVMGHPMWCRDPVLATLDGRLAGRPQIDNALATWTREHDAMALASTLQAAGIMAGAVQDGRDLLHDPQLRARGFFDEVTHAPSSRIGDRPTIGRPWKLDDAPLAITRPAPQLGEHNREILSGLLGLTDAQIADLNAQGVIGDRIPAGRSIAPLALDAMRRNRRIGEHDPDYRGPDAG
jgi:crotonobetainyl-CoA:carnitine CoA-transferase CaiB-like acyl-CoA transferase